MPTYSGHIGDLISFDVENAGAVTGAYFGSALSDSIQAQPNNSTLNARVPTEANWGHVKFYKPDTSEVHNAIGTGLQQTGALNDLETKLAGSGLLGACASGSITYSNLYDASGICNLSASGVTEDLASGRFYDAYGSGLCGSDLNPPYTDSGYSEATTRVSNFQTIQDDAGSWLAIGGIEDTGNFIYQKASAAITCPITNVDSTSYKFVPIPIVSTFTPKEGQAGNPLIVYGNALADVSAVSISGVAVTFQVDSNTQISGTIPAGEFKNKIHVIGPSGVVGKSTSNYVTLGDLGTDPVDTAIKITAGQSVKKPKGYSAGTVSVLGKNFVNLNTAYARNQADRIYNFFNDPNFSYSPTSVQIPISGLDEGLYDVTIASYTNLDTEEKIITIIDSPQISYSFKNVLTTELINEPQMHSSDYQAFTNFNGKKYHFTLLERANKICLQFDNQSIKAGKIKYELERDLGNDSNTRALYYIDGFGGSEALSKQNALDMFNSGIYTRDYYGDPYDQYSYKLYSCVCDITDSGTITYDSYPKFPRNTLVTGVLTGDINLHPTVLPVKELCRTDFAAYTGSNDNLDCIESGFTYSSGVVGYTSGDEMTLEHSSASTGTNITDIESQLLSHPKYEITNYVHELFSSRESGVYGSGISFPYPTNLINNYDSQPWRNILHSGIHEQFPSWPAEVDMASLTSGYSVVESGMNLGVSSVSITGKNEAEAKDVLEYMFATGYSICETGNYSAQIIDVTGSTVGSGTMFGYC